MFYLYLEAWPSGAFVSCSFAHRYDTVHGVFDGEVSHDGENLIVDGTKIRVSRNFGIPGRAVTAVAWDAAISWISWSSWIS